MVGDARHSELGRRGDIVPAPPRSLMDRPQRLGFLPTFWFWRGLYREKRLRMLLTLLALPAWGLTLLWWTYIGPSLLAPIVLMYLAEGIIERLVRSEITRRRRALEPGAQGEKPTANVK